MKLFVKKTAPKKAVFTAINESALKQVKGGTVEVPAQYETVEVPADVA